MMNGKEELNCISGNFAAQNPSLIGKNLASEFVTNPNKELFMLSLAQGYEVTDLQPREKYGGAGALFDYGRWGINGAKYCINGNRRQVGLVTAQTFPREDHYRYIPEELANYELSDLKKKT
eukprot:CAMPEP_0202968348 /NCGR_PEP_ID=MMETSP1396-20130829/13614_1 /ASSEMBLY_ACC=CAM_ASM_000872 /TAXON_ID= /ORGANISM="Pseudokeronopsis sp., Strain Brazil" /LENGTH=120 /DNA_ID=CAMNT_0049694559 /DNA_START=724 /DNA_END=1086 /DNA_ORIENTATION=+